MERKYTLISIAASTMIYAVNMDALSYAPFTVRMMRSLFPGCCRKSGLSAAGLLETELNAAISTSGRDEYGK